MMFEFRSRFDFKRDNNQHLSVILLLPALILILIPHFPEFPVWLSLACVALIVWRLLFELGAAPIIQKKTLLIITLMFVVGLFYSYHTVLGRNAGSALLISMVCLKLFELNTSRDIALISYLAFFSIVVSFLFTQSIATAFLMLTAVIFILTNLMSHHHTSKPFNYTKVNWSVFALHERPHFKLTLKILLQAIPLTLVLFFVFPRINGPLWGLPSDAHNASTGLSDQMSPGRISQLSDSNAVAFRAKFNAGLPVPQQLYWRGPVLWSYDGYNWTAPEKERLAMGFQSFKAENKVDYEIILQPHNNYWVFALDMPASVPERVRVTAEMQFLSHGKVTQLVRYNMSSYLDYFLEYDITLPRWRYLYVPNNAAPQTRDLMTRLSQNKTDKETVKTVLNYFLQNPFYYSRTPPLLFDDPVDEFLFETRRGYCEHFASSFTIMMRLAGIPARVVTGYQGGEINPLDDYMTVRQSDAHAWSEVFLQETGWTRIDPTSVIPPDRIESFLDLARLKSDLPNLKQLLPQSWVNDRIKQLRYTLDAINNRWNQWVLGYDTNRQKSFFEAFGVKEINWQGLSQLMFIILGILTSLLAWQILKPEKRLRDPVQDLYFKFLKKLQQGGLVKRPNEGANDFSQRAIKQYPQHKNAIKHITQLYQSLRYASMTQQKLQQLKNQVKQFTLKKNYD